MLQVHEGVPFFGYTHLTLEFQFLVPVPQNLKMKRSSTQQSTQTLTRSGTQGSYGSKRSRNVRGSRLGKGSALSRFPLFGFPPKLQVKHRYCQIVSISAAAAGVGNWQFRANGMFDPDYTGTGHQPLYFDQLATIYDHFTVLRSYAKFTVSNLATTPATVNVFLNDDTTITPTTIDGRMEQSTGRSLLISKEQGPVVMYCSFNARKTFGGDPLANDNLQGSSAADPTEQAIYTISAKTADDAVATSVILQAEIVYVAVWDELRDIAQS